jgi:hypothetical protein
MGRRKAAFLFGLTLTQNGPVSQYVDLRTSCRRCDGARQEMPLQGPGNREAVSKRSSLGCTQNVV